MTYGLYTVVTGSLAQERRLEALTHNLANMATPGFKADVPIFEVIPGPLPMGMPAVFPTQSHTLSSPLSFVQDTYSVFTSVKVDLSAGELRQTGNSLDVAIHGQGWFSVETPNGVRYTRNGSFTLNPQGQLVTHEGWPVLGNGGPITIQGTNVIINPQGTIIVDGQEIDRLKVVDAQDNDAFQKAEHALFALRSGASVEGTETAADIKQGFLEQSNVNSIKGMTALIDAMRAYESYQKVLQTWHETTGRAVNDVGRLR
jgi:flagellar basal-body rod protein FlgG